MPSIRYKQTSKGLVVSAVCSNMMKGKMVQKVVRLGAVANRTEGNKRFAASAGTIARRSSGRYSRPQGRIAQP